MANGTALVVIDLQVAIVDGVEPDDGPVFRRDEVLARVGELLAAARAAKAPVIHVQHEVPEFPPLRFGAAGWQIHPAVAPRDGEPTIRKRAADAFYGTPLRAELDARGVTRVVLAGAESDCCVDTTARRALSLDYDVVVAADAHTTRSGGEPLSAEQIVAHHNATLANLPHPKHEILVRPAGEIAFSRGGVAASEPPAASGKGQGARGEDDGSGTMSEGAGTGPEARRMDDGGRAGRRTGREQIMSETEAETEMVTTERVLAAIADERDAWRALVEEVGEDRMEEPGPMGEWSFKDLASHLTGWRTHALDRLEAAARGDAPPPTAWPPALRTDDEINAWLHDRDRARPLADVLAEAEATFDRVRSAVGGLSDREANDRARFPMLEGQSLAGAIVSGEFFGHLHEEHEPAVRAWLLGRAGRPGAAR